MIRVTSDKFNKSKLSKIIIIIFIMLVSISFSIVIHNEIEQKKNVNYEVSEFNYEIKTVQSENVESYFKPIDSKIISYVITLDTIQNINGSIGYEIYDTKDNKLLTLGQINMDLAKQSNTLIMDLSSVDLIQNETYKVILYFALDGNLNLRVKDDGNLTDKQTIEFSYNKEFNNLLVIFNLVLLILLVILLIKPNLGKSFLLLSITTGLIGIFIVPPYTAPDELRHFARAYDITEGNIIVDKFSTRENYYNLTFPVCNLPIEFHNLKLVSESSGHNYDRETNNIIVTKMWMNNFAKDFSGNRIETPIQGTYSISPIAYLPQIIFIFLAKVFNFTPILVFYMARLGNVFFASLLGYFAIKKIPRFKNILFLLYFAPGLIFLRSTSSTDGFLFSLVIAFISYVLYLKERKTTNIKLNSIVILSLLLGCIALIKLPYILCAILLLTISDSDSKHIDIKSVKKMVLYTFSMLIFSVLVYFISSKLLVQNEVNLVGKSYLAYFIQHPIKVGNLIIQTFMNSSYDFIANAIQYPISSNLIGVYIITLIFISLFSYNNNFLKKSDKFIFLGTSCIAWLAVLTIFYFAGPSPDLGYIWGLQGRYILPVLPILCLVIPMDNTTNNEIYITKYIGSYIGILSTIHFMQIFSHYWI